MKDCKPVDSAIRNGAMYRRWSASAAGNSGGSVPSASVPRRKPSIQAQPLNVLCAREGAQTRHEVRAGRYSNTSRVYCSSIDRSGKLHLHRTAATPPVIIAKECTQIPTATGKKAEERKNIHPRADTEPRTAQREKLRRRRRGRLTATQKKKRRTSATCYGASTPQLLSGRCLRLDGQE